MSKPVGYASDFGTWYATWKCEDCARECRTSTGEYPMRHVSDHAKQLCASCWCKRDAKEPDA